MVVNNLPVSQEALATDPTSNVEYILLPVKVTGLGFVTQGDPIIYSTTDELNAALASNPDPNLVETAVNGTLSFVNTTSVEQTANISGVSTNSFKPLLMSSMIGPGNIITLNNFATSGQAATDATSNMLFNLD